VDNLMSYFVIISLSRVYLLAGSFEHEDNFRTAALAFVISSAAKILIEPYCNITAGLILRSSNPNSLRMGYVSRMVMSVN
jgi:hypothetical protein